MSVSQDDSTTTTISKIPKTTTLSIQLLYFKALRFIGCFPIKTTVSDGNLKFQLCNYNQLYKYLQTFITIQLACNIVFQIGNFCRYFYFPAHEHERYYYLANLAVGAYSLNGTVAFAFTALNPSSIRALLQEWQEVESAIYYDGDDIYPQIRRAKATSTIMWEKRLLYAKLSTLCFLLLLVMTVFVIISNWKNPRYPPNYYSIFDESFDPSPLYFYAFIFIQGHVVITLMAMSIQFDFMAWSFAHSLTCMLENLEPKPGNNFQASELEFAMTHYSKLSHLVETFNKTYAWLLLFAEVISVAQICTFSIFSIRFLNMVAHSALIVFSCQILIVGARQCVLLPCLGSVKGASIKFIQSWKDVVPYVKLEEREALLRRKLNSCLPMEFQCGNFFQVSSTTLLTFFSITITFLMVLLQL